MIISKLKIEGGGGEGERENRNLEDPLVDDDDGDIERPPLKDGQERSDNAPLENEALFHILLGLLLCYEDKRREEKSERRGRTRNGVRGTSSALMEFASPLSPSLCM